MNSFLICCIKLQHFKDLNRVSIHCGNDGHDLEFFSVLEFTTFRVLSWNALDFFCAVHHFFSTVIIPVFCLKEFCLAFSQLVHFDHVPYYYKFVSFRKIINMAKHNCTSNDDWLIELEWVEKFSSARTACCANYAIIHLIFLIWEEVQSPAIQKGRSTRMSKFLGSHF